MKQTKKVLGDYTRPAVALFLRSFSKKKSSSRTVMEETDCRGSLKAIFLLGILIVASSLSLQANGLFWDQPELTEWQKRSIEGPYKLKGDAYDPLVPGEWERIVSDKNAFMKDPTGERKSSIDIDNGVGWIVNHISMLSAAFYSLVKDDAVVRRAVIEELVWHANQSGLQIRPDFYLKTDLGNFWQPAWLGRMLMAADFVKKDCTSSERAAIEKWLRNWALAHEQSVHKELSVYRFTERYDRNYSTGGHYFKNPSFEHYAYQDSNGKMRNPAMKMGRAYNNRRATVMQFVSLFALWSDDEVLIDRSKLYFEEWLKFSVFPDGSTCEYQRNEDVGRNIQAGFIYNTINIEAFVTMAEALARRGDLSLYELSTSDGIHGTEVPAGGSPKTVLTTVYTHLDLIEHKRDWYNAGGLINEDYRIDNVVNKVGHAPEGRQWANEIWFAPMGNRFWQDARVKQGYTRSAPTSTPLNDQLGPAGPYGPVWRGHAAIFPSVLFMFGDMEHVPTPYGDGSTIPTPAPEPTPEPTPDPEPVDPEPLPSEDIEGYRQSTIEGMAIFGLDPAWAAGREFDKAFDGNPATFYDYATKDVCFLGFDLGEAKRISAIHFQPRSGKASRMLGGLFQGSNESSTRGFETLYEITSVPAEKMHAIEVDGLKAYRYYRYLAPTASHGNIAEFSFTLAEEPATVDVDLVYSSQYNWSDYAPLSGLHVTEPVYVSVKPADNVQSVEFYYNVNGQDVHVNSEGFGPFDYIQENTPLNPADVAGGKMTVVAVVTQLDGSVERIEAAISADVEALVDSDRLPDDWETKYFGGINVKHGGEDEDFDGDGVTNYDEWLANTNPNDVNDALQLEPILGVAWNSQVDLAYAIEYTDDNWVSHASSTEIAGTGGPMYWIDPSARDVIHNRQYRIVVVTN